MGFDAKVSRMLTLVGISGLALSLGNAAGISPVLLFSIGPLSTVFVFRGWRQIQCLDDHRRRSAVRLDGHGS